MITIQVELNRIEAKTGKRVYTVVQQSRKTVRFQEKSTPKTNADSIWDAIKREISKQK